MVGLAAGRVRDPLLSGVAVMRRHRVIGRCGLVEEGVPAEGERAAHQHLMAVDRGGGADLEVGPAEFVFDLLVALFNLPPLMHWYLSLRQILVS